MRSITLASLLLATTFVLAGCPDGGQPPGLTDAGETCGNGVLDPGESCDPAATGADACATTCDDGVPCTTDTQTGSADTCDLVCTHAQINACIDADGCCAPGCNALSDSDCSATCGNGIRETGETCDGNCPVTCNDGIACTADIMTGSDDTCDVVCSNDDITACVDGDGCCPGSCSSANDNDCSASCGNGVIESGETCDTGIAAGETGACPVVCNDGSACTVDRMTGSAGNCSAACAFTPITACVHGDGCCAPGCNSQSDNDCSASCGNGVIESGETCDGNCPTSCNDGSACTIDTLVGSADNCSATCNFASITQCNSGDGCCPGNCTSQNDSDCSASCGNGIVETGETCDGDCPTNDSACNDGVACTMDTLSGSAANCSATCLHASISQCVDGDGCCPGACNASNDNDCSSSCGNGTVEPGETCDGNCPTTCNDGNACTTDTMNGTPASCNVTCSYQTITQCTGGDGCCAPGCTSLNDSDCSASCGNGVVEAGEQCDNGIAGGLAGACPTTCNDGQACTIDNLTGSAATCSASCGYQSITQCTHSDGCCPSGCNNLTDNDCSASCGNGIVEAGETCDGDCPATCNDGNACTTDTRNGSAQNCNVTCTYATTSQCVDGDGCCPGGCNANTDTDCSASCGNNIVEAGETCDGNCRTSCDDGNSCTIDAILGSAATCNVSCSYQSITQCQSGDGCCPAGCTGASDTDCSSTCGNGTIDVGETCDGNCPSTCNDGDACTIDSMTGSAANCNVECSNQGITSCVDADGCCPLGCDAASDTDCSGAGVVGDPCVSGGDCSSGACITEGDYGWPGGYCSAGCNDAQGYPCPSGSHCGLTDADGTGVCLADCTTNADCGGSYECYDGDTDTAGTAECLPVAAGPGIPGDPCAEVYLDCGGGQLGVCMTEFYGNMQAYGGYCSQYCYADPANPANDVACPTGSHCGLVGSVQADTYWGYCLQDCVDGSDCRATGYACADGDYAGDGSECFAAGTGTGGPGAACQGIWDCGGGVDGMCIPPSSTFKDGYCNPWCSNDQGVPCPAGSHCTQATGWGTCVDDCGNSTHCRGDGYACYNADGITGNECWYSGTGTGVVGAACSGIWDCAGGQDAYCATAGEGFSDGYCLIDCSTATGTTCPAGSICGNSYMTDWCVDSCGTSSECRAGYECLESTCFP